MEETLRKAFDAVIELIPGTGGIFDVTVDGKLLFCKAKEGRFPDTEEIINLIKRSFSSH